MTKVISIYDAKTNLSKLVKKAEAGETIYIGAYGKVQAVIAPVPKRKSIPIGIWEHKKKLNAYKVEDLIGPDKDVIAEFEQSADRPLF